jgi:hypothetical protein
MLTRPAKIQTTESRYARVMAKIQDAKLSARADGDEARLRRVFDRMRRVAWLDRSALRSRSAIELEGYANAR